MKSKILITVLVILSVVEYTLAVINFTQWAVLPGIQAVALAVTMTDKFYCEHNIDDDADVQISNRKEAEEEWQKFINKYFDIPCTMSCNWFGVYDLKEHKWTDKYGPFSKHVKEG